MTTTSSRPSVPAAEPGTARALLDEAVGRGAVEPADGRWGGPAGNGRLTGWLGVLVLYLVAAQLFTLLDVTKVLAWHVAIGGALLPIALAKTGVTGWRMINYYRGVPAYREAGAPPLPLRVLGPLVVVSTLALVGTGLTLLALGPTEISRPLFTLLGVQVAPLTIHQAVFFAFVTFTGLHLLARAVPAWRRTVGTHGVVVAGAAQRALVIVTVVIAAVISSTLVEHAYRGWF